MVAALTRAGFVTGPYATYGHGSIAPALLAASIFATVILLSVFGEALARAAGSREDWVVCAATRFGEISPLRLAPAVFAAQLILLFGMESAEQIVAVGHPLGFIASLGSPLVLALTMHALAALAVVSAIRFACQALTLAVRAVASVIGSAVLRASVIKARAGTSALRVAIDTRARLRRLTPLAWRIANRPPPLQVPA